MGMVQKPGQRCRCQRGIATEGLFPFPKAQIRRQDDRVRLISFGYDLEDQIRLSLAERELADLVDNQQPRAEDAPLEASIVAPLPLCALQMKHQIRRRHEAELDAALRGQIAQSDGQVRLSCPAWPEEDDVLLAVHECQAGKLQQTLSRRPRGKIEVVVVQRFDGRKSGEPSHGLP